MALRWVMGEISAKSMCTLPRGKNRKGQTE